MARFPVATSEFQTIITSVTDGTQPSTAYGTSVTPGASNTYGSYASVMSGATLTSDAYGLEIIVSSAYTNATDRGMLVTIGFDPAGGTSFGGLGGVTGNEISNLLCSGAYSWYTNGTPGGGHRFYFPVYVKSGTSIGAKAQTNNVTAGTVRVAAIAYCQPSRRAGVRAGSFVRTIGANTTTTDGVSVTAGTVSEGSWTSIGAVSDKIWHMNIGLGARTATQVDSAALVDVGVGDGSNKRTIMRDIYAFTSTGENCHKYGRSDAFVNLASGDTIYGRAQGSAAPTGFSIAAYCTGG